MEAKIAEMFGHFGIVGDLVDYKIFKSGHIITTCMVTVNENGEEKSYILQKINHNVFKNPEQVMENISGVTNFIREKIEMDGEDPSRRVLNFIPTPEGEYYALDENNNYWRVYEFIDRSITFDSTKSLSVLRETGRAFGEFQNQLADYPSDALWEIIPNFHNTPKRFENLKRTIMADPTLWLSTISTRLPQC